MIVKEENWDMNPQVSTIKEFFVNKLFKERIEPAVFFGKQEGVTNDRMQSDIENMVAVWMQQMYELDDKRSYFYNDTDVRSYYIFTINFLPTGGTLTSIIIKFRDMVDPVRLDVIY